MRFFLTFIKIVLLLVAIAYFTIAERKVMAAIQRRRGPNVVGIYGLLQPLADGLKLLVKKLLIPTSSNKIIFIAAPLLVLTLSLSTWSVIPFFVTTSNFKFNTGIIEISRIIVNELSNLATVPYTISLLLALSSLNVYGIIISGWSSNSKYAFLGSLRSAAQMISYEVSIGLVLLPVILLASSLNLTSIVIAQEKCGWFWQPLFPCVIIFFISMLAETNRTPFDLPEAEAELVAGYNVEYSSIIFAMFFLGEYSNMLLMSTLMSLLFFGGWLVPFGITLGKIKTVAILSLSIKVTFFCFLFILVRATVPRYKYNQLMDIGWKIFLPIALSYLCLVASWSWYCII